MEETKQSIELAKQSIDFAQQFFFIGNAITAFVVLQVVALIYGLKEAKFSAAFLRWRPYTSLLSKHAGNGYIFAVLVCGIAEFLLRWAGGQQWHFLVACGIAVLLRCMAIYWTGVVFVLVFVTICREQDWLNKYGPEREFQTPRVMHTLSKSEKLVHRLAMRVDKRLFGAPLEGVILAEEFDEPNAQLRQFKRPKRDRESFINKT